MQAAEILLKISRLNNEINAKQNEIQYLKELYTQRANSDIQNALQAVTHAPKTSRTEEEAGPSKRNFHPYERRSSDESVGSSAKTRSNVSARDHGGIHQGSTRNPTHNIKTYKSTRDPPEYKLPRFLASLVKADEKHCCLRIQFMSYKEHKLSNELLYNENHNFNIIVRNFRYQSLDFFCNLVPLRRNVMAQTYDMLGFIHFEDPRQNRTHYLRVTAKMLNVNDSHSEDVIHVLCQIKKIEGFVGQGKKLIFENNIFENNPQIFTIMAIKNSRVKGYRGPIYPNETYTMILDTGDWITTLLPPNNEYPEFKCLTSRMQIFDPNHVSEPAKKRNPKKLNSVNHGRSKGRPGQCIPNRLNRNDHQGQGFNPYQNPYHGHQGNMGWPQQQMVQHQPQGWFPQPLGPGWSFQHPIQNQIRNPVIVTEPNQDGWGSVTPPPQGSPAGWGSPSRHSPIPTPVVTVSTVPNPVVTVPTVPTPVVTVPPVTTQTVTVPPVTTTVLTVPPVTTPMVTVPVTTLISALTTLVPPTITSTAINTPGATVSTVAPTPIVSNGTPGSSEKSNSTIAGTTGPADLLAPCSIPCSIATVTTIHKNCVMSPRITLPVPPPPLVTTPSPVQITSPPGTTTIEALSAKSSQDKPSPVQIQPLDGDTEAEDKLTIDEGKEEDALLNAADDQSTMTDATHITDLLNDK